jgi:hypothetical protein
VGGPHTHGATTVKSTDMHVENRVIYGWMRLKSEQIPVSSLDGLEIKWPSVRHLCCQAAFSYSTVEVGRFGFVENSEGVSYHKHCAIWQFHVLWPQWAELYVFCTSCNTRWTLPFSLLDSFMNRATLHMASTPACVVWSSHGSNMKIMVFWDIPQCN